MRAFIEKLKQSKVFYVAAVFPIGLLICRLPFLRNYKFHLLSSWQIPEKRKGVDHFFYGKALSYWFRFEYLSEKDPDTREAMKEMLMGGESGEAWAKYYDSQPLDFESKVGHLTYSKACPVLPELDRVLSSTTGSLVVVQMGSSSGREIAWLATRNPNHIFAGIDAYPDVIAFSSERYHLPNLRFERCSAKEISCLLSRYRNQRIIEFSSGSLQYVQPEHLEMFFNSLGHIPKLQMVALESASESQCNPEELEGSLWRGNFSYTHNYRFYAEKAGFETQMCEIIRPYFPYEDFPKHRNTVNYFYWAMTKITKNNVRKGSKLQPV